MPYAYNSDYYGSKTHNIEETSILHCLERYFPKIEITAWFASKPALQIFAQPGLQLGLHFDFAKFITRKKQ